MPLPTYMTPSVVEESSRSRADLLPFEFKNFCALSWGRPAPIGLHPQTTVVKAITLKLGEILGSRPHTLHEEGLLMETFPNFGVITLGYHAGGYQPSVRGGLVCSRPPLAVPFNILKVQAANSGCRQNMNLLLQAAHLAFEA